MGCRLTLLALLLALAPVTSWAAEEDDSFAAGDEERPGAEADGEQDSKAAADADDGRASDDDDEERAARRRESAPPAATSESRPASRGDDFVPATQSLTLEPGGAAALLGGYAFPRFVLDGSIASTTTAFATAGAAARLFWDFPAMDLDWRVGLNTIFTDYYAVRGTVGVKKDIGPAAMPRIVSRGGVGVEVMLGQEDNATFIVPLFVLEGDVGVEFDIVPNLFSIGAGFELTVHYGLPAGIGLNLGGYVPRLKLLF